MTSPASPRISRRNLVAATAAAIALPTIPRVGQAQTPAYPTRPINVIVPFTPGGVPDLTVRAIGRGMEEDLKQPLVILNRPGGGTVIGATAAANAAPDGYTLFLATATSMVISPLTMASVPYDPVRSFTPIGFHGSSPAAVLVHPSLPIRTFAELIEHLRKNPRTLYASPGIATAAHLAAESVRQHYKLDCEHVGYTGSSAAELALVGGHAQILFSNFASCVPHIKAGTMRPLAITVPNRSELMPTVPTISESGIPGFDVCGWSGFVAPTGTPRAIIDQLNRSMNAAMTRADIRAKLLEVSLVPEPGKPEDLATRIQSERERLGRVIKESNIKL